MNQRCPPHMLEPKPFDETDDDLMHDLLGNQRLADPVQGLLITLAQIEKTNGCFGADKAKCFDALLPDLKKLRAACIEEYREGL